jgi:hypothetical protein
MLTLKGLSTRKQALLTFQKGPCLYQTFLHDNDLTALTRCERHELQDDASSFSLAGATLSGQYDALIFVSVSQESVRRAGNRVTATSNWDATRKENLPTSGSSNPVDRNEQKRSSNRDRRPKALKESVFFLY